MHAHLKPQSLFISMPQFLRDLALISAGSVLCALAINGILIPQHFVTGGITGISLIIHNCFPFLNVGLIFILLNIPLFALAWMAVGRRFFFYSLIGSLSVSLCLGFIHLSIPLEDKMLNALLAGILSGAGVGITLKSSGSQGGVDILSIMLLQRFSISIGTTLFGVNALVLLLTGIFYSLEAVLYALIILFVSSKVLNLVVSGINQRKSVFIISPKWQEISKEILKDIRRGVTIIKGEGGYSGKKEHILYVVVTLREIGSMKRLIQQLDPDAFVVISETLEVMNYRIGNQPHW